MPSVSGGLLAFLAVLALLGGLLALPIGMRFTASYRRPEGGDGDTAELSILADVSLWRTPVRVLSFTWRGRTLAIAVTAMRAAAGRHVSQRHRPVGTAVRRPRDVGTPGSSTSRGVGRSLSRIGVGLARRAVWTRLSWTTTVGLSDAAATALAAGGLWTLKGWLAAWAHSHLRLGSGQPEYSVVPDFSGKGVESTAKGIGVLRLGHIIIALPGLATALYHLLLARRVK